MPLPPYDPDRVPHAPAQDESLQDYFQNLKIKQEAQTKKDKDQRDLRKARNLTIKGVAADPDQRRNMELVITTATGIDKSSDRSVLSVICAVIVESLCRNLKGGDQSSKGILQVIDSTAASHHIDPRDIEACVKEFMTVGFYNYGSAIHIARSQKDLSPGEIAWRVQGPREDLRGEYAKWEKEARKWLAAAKGGRIEGGVSTYRKAFQYKREKKENSWDCMQRLAGDVKWALFPVGKVLYYMSEPDLFARRVAYVLTPDDDSLIEFTYDIDWRAKVPTNEGVLTVNLDRWGAPPGYPIELEGFGPPDGRWLIVSTHRDWFGTTAEVTIRQPVVPVPEDASEKVTRSTGGAEPGGEGMELYKACRRISDANPPYGPGAHGRPLSQLTSKEEHDCSSSVSLALYRAKLWDHTAIARVSGQFDTWGHKGRGTIFTVCYNAGHVYIRFEDALSVNAQRFDTSSWSGDKNSERGPRLRSSEGPPGDQGYGLRHWPDM
jgi:hypothetical protein